MEQGLVLKSTGKWYTLELSTGQIVQARIRGKLRLEGLSTTNPIAAGDKVFLLPDVDAEGIRLIDNIVPRKNYLVRKSTNLSKQMQILAANIDHAYLVVTLKSPVTQIAFIDRFLVSAESFRIPTTILFNKTDLYGEEELGLLAVLKNIYSTIGYGVAAISTIFF
jgi:ribosome biogenesis GTPase